MQIRQDPFVLIAWQFSQSLSGLIVHRDVARPPVLGIARGHDVAQNVEPRPYRYFQNLVIAAYRTMRAMGGLDGRIDDRPQIKRDSSGVVQNKT